MEHQLCKPQKLCSICWRVLCLLWSSVKDARKRKSWRGSKQSVQLSLELAVETSMSKMAANWVSFFSLYQAVLHICICAELWKTCMRRSLLSQLFFLLHEQLFLNLQVQLLILRQFLFGRKLGLSCCFLLGLPGSGNSIICNKVILKAPLHLDSHLQDSFFFNFFCNWQRGREGCPAVFQNCSQGQSKAS
ncbi:unnamed protein product [Sphagnum tenellum]